MKIKSITKREKDGKTFYGLVMIDGQNELNGSSADKLFESSKEGDEVDVEAKNSNREYNGKPQYYFNGKKTSKSFPQKDWSFEKKRVALECSVKFSSTVEDALENADKFLAWL